MSCEAVTSGNKPEYIIRPVPDFTSQGLMCPIHVADRCKGYVESFPGEQYVFLLLFRCPLRKHRDISKLDRLHPFCFGGRGGSGKIGESVPARWRVWRSGKIVTALCCHSYVRGCAAIQWRNIRSTYLRVAFQKKPPFSNIPALSRCNRSTLFSFPQHSGIDIARSDRSSLSLVRLRARAYG